MEMVYVLWGPLHQSFLRDDLKRDVVCFWIRPSKLLLRMALLNVTRCPNGQKSDKNSKIHRKIKFSELGWPGVEILSGPRGSILHTARPSQVHYETP